MRLNLRLLAPAALVACAQIALAQERAPAPEVQGADEQALVVARKLQLLARMVEGAAARRAEESGSPEVLGRLDQARAACRQARAAHSAGDLQGASAHADRGLRLVGQALRSAAEPEREASQSRRRFDEARARVIGFRSAYDRILAEKSRARGGVLDEAEIEAITLRAEQLAREGKFAEALSRMSKAAQMLEVALARVRDKETLVHELNFETPAEEYEYERQRNRSYALLLELTLAEGKGATPNGEAGRKHLSQNLLALARAQAAIDAGDAGAAIRILDEATRGLIHQLRMSGLTMP